MVRLRRAGFTDDQLRSFYVSPTLFGRGNEGNFMNDVFALSSIIRRAQVDNYSAWEHYVLDIDDRSYMGFSSRARQSRL